MPEFSRLVALLNNTKLQKTDIALFDVIRALIGDTQQLQSQSAVALSEGIGPLANADFITKTNQLAQLAMSWYLVAGSNVTLDDSTPNQLIINVTIPSSVISTPVFLEGNDKGEDGLTIPGPAGATGATGSAGIGIPGQDGNDGSDWSGFPPYTPPPVPADYVLMSDGSTPPQAMNNGGSSFLYIGYRP